MKSKQHFLFFIFLACSIILQAQEKSLSNLNYAISLAKNIRQKIDILNDFADTLCLHKKDTGRILALNALQLSKAQNYLKGIGEASHSMGLIHFRRNNDSAIYYFQQSRVAFLKQYPGMTKFAFTLNNLSRTYDELLKPDSAIYWARQALMFVDGNKETALVKKRWLMFSNGAMANAQAGNSNYDSANFYYLKAIALAEQQGNKRMLEVYFKGIAGIQAQLRNYDKAIDFGKKAIAYIEDDCGALTIILANMGGYYLKIKDFDNATLMADSSLREGRRCNVGNSVGRNYSILGSCKMEQKKYAAAMEYFKTGLYQARKMSNSKSSISNLLRKVGEAYDAMDSLPQAKEYYTSALQTAEGDKEFASNIYFLLAKLAYKEADYNNAYIYLQRYQVFHDAVYTNEKAKAIEELNTQYETEKKDQQLLLFSKDKQLQQAELGRQLQRIEKDNAIKNQQQLAIDNFELETEKKDQLLQIQELQIENSKIKQQDQQLELSNTTNRLAIEQQQKDLNLSTIKDQRNWFIFLLVAGVIAAIISWLLFNRYKLVKKIQSQAELTDQRQRISRDLHDEVGATLSGISMYSHLVKEQLKSNNNIAVDNSLNVMQQSSSQMVEKLNDIVWLINPEKDSLQQLIGRLEDYAINMAAIKGMQVKVKVPQQISDAVLSAEMRKNIYLFCKEAINNAVKHSKATLLNFSVEETNNFLHFTVEDNGSGFDAAKAVNGNGLDNMRNRAKEMNADLFIASVNGTTIKLVVKITS